MEELKTSERRNVELEDAYEEKNKESNHVHACIEKISHEKDQSEANFMSFKNEVKETLDRMKSSHQMTMEELEENKKLLIVALKIKKTLQKEVATCHNETKKIMKQSDAAVQRVRQEMTDASMEEIHQLKQDNEEHELENTTLKENMQRMERSKNNLQEGLTSKREELRCCREETSVTRRRAKELEEKMERIGVEQRETQDQLQVALQKREQDLSLSRKKNLVLEEEKKNLEQTMSLTIQEESTKAVAECEERLGSEIALLNRKLTQEDQANRKTKGEVKELTLKIAAVGNSIRLEVEQEMKELNGVLEKKEQMLLTMNDKHVEQKKQLIDRVGLVDKSFTSFKLKSREQITSLTENVAEQTKQLSKRIAECERLRVQVETMNDDFSKATETTLHEHREELKAQVTELMTRHEEESMECKATMVRTRS